MNRPQQNRMSSRSAPRIRLCNILFLGNTGSGKASMRNKIIYGDFRVSSDPYDPTLEDSHQKWITIDSEQCRLDIAALNYDDRQVAFMLETRIREADGIILMYSICSPESFSDLEAIWTTVKLLKAPEEKELYVEVVGTMSDMWEKRGVKTEDGKALAERLNCGFSECSAKEGENCDVLIENLIGKILTGREQEQILRDAKQRKEDDEREKRERKKNGVVKRVLKRCVEIMTMGT